MMSNKSKTMVKKSSNYKIHLTFYDEDIPSSLDRPEGIRVPLFSTDLQHLLLLSCASANYSSISTGWCHLKRKKLNASIVLVLNNIAYEDFLAKSELFTFNRRFNNKLHLMIPTIMRDSIIEDLATVAIISGREKGIYTNHGNIAYTLARTNDQSALLKSLFLINDTDKPNTVSSNNSDKFSRTELLLTVRDMLENDYRIPMYVGDKNTEFVFSSTNYNPVTENSPMFAIDCEMVYTGPSKIELARISVVNERGQLLYSSFVKPINPVTDYYTNKSGITEKLLEGIKVRLHHVQNKLRKILPADAILIGQSLNFDLKVLQMYHPYVIDTSVIFNNTSIIQRKSSLKQLARQFLDIKIQTNKNGHDPEEDALASMQLVQLKLSNSFTFGNKYLMDELARKNEIKLRQKQFDKLDSKWELKTYTIVGPNSIKTSYKKILKEQKDVLYIHSDSNEEVVSKVLQTYKDSKLTMAHINLDIENDLSIKNVDFLLNNICDEIDDNTLLTIIFNSNESPNSVLFSGVKMEEAN